MDAAHKFRAKSGRPFKYPYDIWFDGNTRIISKPADFGCDPDTMAHMLRSQARKRGGYCSATHGESTVTFCFYASEAEAGNE